jgi:glycosyltransferase involved in cell wall biosynthesis
VRVYRDATLLVHPAVAEPFGMTPLEAAAQRVPSVVTHSGGITEFVVDGVSGRSFPARNADKLAEILIELLADAGERERLGLVAYQRQREAFTMDRNALQLLSRGVHGWVLPPHLWNDGPPVVPSRGRAEASAN